MALEIVMTQGKFVLLPISEAAAEEGEADHVVGYYFRFTDQESGITLVAPLPVEQARVLGEALLNNAPEGSGGTSIEVAGPEVLRRLRDHRGKGGGARS